VTKLNPHRENGTIKKHRRSCVRDTGEVSKEGRLWQKKIKWEKKKELEGSPKIKIPLARGLDLWGRIRETGG